MAADEIMLPASAVDERTKLIAALAWSLRNVPLSPPKDAESGWTSGARLDHERNREAAAAILVGAVTSGTLEDAARALPAPAELMSFIFPVEEPRTGEPVVCGPSTPIHFLREPGKPGCMKTCPACVAELPR